MLPSAGRVGGFLKIIRDLGVEVTVGNRDTDAGMSIIIFGDRCH